MILSDEHRAGRRKRYGTRAPLTLRIDARVMQRLQAEAAAHNVDLAALGREYLEASVLGTGVGGKIDDIRRCLDDLVSDHRSVTRSELDSFQRSLQERFAEIERSQMQLGERIEAIGKSFRLSFDKIGKAFLDLQTYLVGEETES